MLTLSQARTARQRAIHNENDENSTTRVTRAKAAAGKAQTDAPLPAKKPLQAKKNSVNAKVAEDSQPKKRAALGDVSNVNKRDMNDRSAPIEEKKPSVSNTKQAKPSRPAANQKESAATSTRPLLSSKDKNKPTRELKRSASSSALEEEPQKKRISSSASRPSPKKEFYKDASSGPAKGRSSGEKIEKITNIVEVTKRQPDGTQKVEKDQHVYYPSDEDEHVPMSEAPEDTIERMNAEDLDDPLMVAEYVYEILEYMKVLEQRTMPNAQYMSHQKELEWRMRGVLIDWLLEVHTRFHLLPETLYLTVNIIDRFLSHKVVQLERLQLVGIAAMFIASKYEEVLSPHITNFVHVADEGFSEAEILSAERYILATLNYDMSFPNPMHFMRRISKADNYDIQTRTLAKYLLEISLLDHNLMAFPPSVNAAASMYLSRAILEKGAWDEILVHYSGYTEEELLPAVEGMIEYLRGPVQHNAFYKKYAGKKFMKGEVHKVSTLGVQSQR